jgi:hypothetical protein
MGRNLQIMLVIVVWMGCRLQRGNHGLDPNETAFLHIFGAVLGMRCRRFVQTGENARINVWQAACRAR